jgi:hypothetical protein
MLRTKPQQRMLTPPCCDGLRHLHPEPLRGSNAGAIAGSLSLMESGVRFEAVDLPRANNLTIHIMAAMAEYEADAISARTKAALTAAKARGTKLGGLRLNVAKVAARGGRASARKRGRSQPRAKPAAALRVDVSRYSRQHSRFRDKPVVIAVTDVIDHRHKWSPRAEGLIPVAQDTDGA